MSQTWKNISDDERSHWVDIANRDRERFEREKAVYSGPWKVLDVKDPGAPKKPMSAFLAFGNERRKAIAEANPMMSNTEISHVLSKLWKEYPESLKQQYRDREAQERQAFKKIRSDWEQQKERSRGHSPSNPCCPRDNQDACGGLGGLLSFPFTSAPMPLNDTPHLQSMMSLSASSYHEGQAAIQSPIQPLCPDKSGIYSTPAMHQSFASGTTFPSTTGAYAGQPPMVSDGSLEDFFQLGMMTPMDPTPLPPTKTRMKRDSYSTISEEPMVSMNDLMDELEILGEVDLDDSPVDQHAPATCFSDQLTGMYPHDSMASSGDTAHIDHWVAGQPGEQAKALASAQEYDSRESRRLNKLAEDLGDAGVKMFIGAFR